MPSVPTIMTTSRKLCNKEATMSGYSDADLLPYLNLVYADVQEALRRKVDGEYFSYTFTTNLVNGTDKYLIPQADATTPGVISIIELAILEESTSSYYTTIYEKGTKHIPKFTDYEATNASTPYYDKRGGYIYLYPTPTANITDGMKLLASVTLIDLTATGTEDLIFPNHQELRVHHKVLVEGLRTYIYELSGETELRNNQESYYRTQLEKMCMSLQKGQEPIVMEPFNGEQYW